MKALIAAVAIGVVACGCKDDKYAQGGKYCESGTGQSTYDKDVIVTVSGQRLGSSGGIVGPQEHVLYLAVRLPEVRLSSGSSSEAGPTKSTWSLSFELSGGRFVKVEAEWDRVADVVTIAGRRFDRGRGNVFLIEVDPKGVLTPRQNSKLRTAVVPEGDEERVVREEFPPAPSTPPK